MLNFLIHWYQLAEVYAVILAWITLPLAYYASYLFMRNHYGLFIPTALPAQNKEGLSHGSN